MHFGVKGVKVISKETSPITLDIFYILFLFLLLANILRHAGLAPEIGLFLVKKMQKFLNAKFKRII